MNREDVIMPTKGEGNEEQYIYLNSHPIIIVGTYHSLNGSLT